MLVGLASYSRWTVGRMLPSRESHDLLLGHLACLVDLGRVPRAGVYDNEAVIARWRRGRPELTDAFQAFRGALGMGGRAVEAGGSRAEGARGAPPIASSQGPPRAALSHASHR